MSGKTQMACLQGTEFRVNLGRPALRAPSVAEVIQNKVAQLLRGQLTFKSLSAAEAKAPFGQGVAFVELSVNKGKSEPDAEIHKVLISTPVIDGQPRITADSKFFIKKVNGALPTFCRFAGPFGI